MIVACAGVPVIGEDVAEEKILNVPEGSVEGGVVGVCDPTLSEWESNSDLWPVICVEP